MAKQQGAKRVRRRERRNISHGQAHIKASFNNTIISISDQTGATVVWTSGARSASRGRASRLPMRPRSAEEAARRAGEHGIRKLDVIVSGTGSGRDTAVRTLQNMGMEVTWIRDVTPIPHNGCRPKKRRAADGSLHRPPSQGHAVALAPHSANRSGARSTVAPTPRASTAAGASVRATI